MAKIDSVYDFTDKGLIELKSWLEPWFLTRCPCAAAAESACTPYPDALATIAATRNLRGHWRLGDGASPFADTSGFTGGPRDAVKTSTGTAMTDSIVGALPTADDDGAVQFNNTSGGAADYLDVPQGSPLAFDFGSGTADMTVAAWVNPTASASTFTGAAVASWYSGVFGPQGWMLGVDWPTRVPFFARREDDSSPVSVSVTGSPLAADTWAFLVGRYDDTDGHSLYVNGVLVDSDSGTVSNIQAGPGPNIGRNNEGSAPFNSFCGGIDEVSIWGDVLSTEEISTLYESGTCIPGSGSGDNTYVTVQTGAPSTYLTPLVFDDTPATGGLYGWDGTAYQQVGGPI